MKKDFSMLFSAHQKPKGLIRLLQSLPCSPAAVAKLYHQETLCRHTLPSPPPPAAASPSWIPAVEGIL